MSEDNVNTLMRMLLGAFRQDSEAVLEGFIKELMEIPIVKDVIETNPGLITRLLSVAIGTIPSADGSTMAGTLKRLV